MRWSPWSSFGKALARDLLKIANRPSFTSRMLGARDGNSITIPVNA